MLVIFHSIDKSAWAFNISNNSYYKLLLLYAWIISLYFTIRGEHAVNSWTEWFNCMATDPPPDTDPALTNDRRVWRNIYSKETMEVLKKGVAYRKMGSIDKTYNS